VSVASESLLSWSQAPQTTGRPQDQVRRILDISLSLAGIIFLLPLFIFIGAAVKLQDGGPMLFSQVRIGRNGRRFRCYKFRSMWPDAEERLAKVLASSPAYRAEWEASHKLKSDPRITRFGTFLRYSSLDELPQLFNILTGDMSVVGPRPIVEAEVERYGRWYRYYASVKPGLTGLWQISGRSDVAYRRRIAMDRLFCRSNSLKIYAWTILATVPSVLAARGSY
jgi:lipopolysaccharide/colanic/teichoic acid biosynthesis glycosyltransferase